MATTEDLVRWFQSVLPYRTTLQDNLAKVVHAHGAAMVPVLAVRLAMDDDRWAPLVRAFVPGLPDPYDIYLGMEWWHKLRTGPHLDDLFLGALVLRRSDEPPQKGPFWMYAGDAFCLTPAGAWLVWVTTPRLYDIELALPDFLVQATSVRGRFLPRPLDMSLDERRLLASFPGVQMRSPIVRQGREFWLPQNLGLLAAHPRDDLGAVALLSSGLDHCTVFDVPRPSAYHHLLQDD